MKPLLRPGSRAGRRAGTPSRSSPQPHEELVLCNSRSSCSTSRSRGSRPWTSETASPHLDEDLLRVSDLDWSLPTDSWIKQPLYFSYQSKSACEHLVQSLHLPPMHRGHRFKADDHASWDPIAENAFQATHALHGASYMDQARTYGAQGKSMLVVILIYSARCNPFTLEDLDILKRARKAVEETYAKVAVAGSLVVPWSDDMLTAYIGGDCTGRHLDFRTRVEVAREVTLAARANSWVLVDSCMEGCMKKTPGKITPYVAVYARGRLHSPHYEPRVLEVSVQDSCDTRPKAERAMGKLYVDPVDRESAVPSLDSIMTVEVAAPKQSLCDELLEEALRKPTDVNNFANLDRLCGYSAARVIHDRFRMNSKGFPMKQGLRNPGHIVK